MLCPYAYKPHTPVSDVTSLRVFLEHSVGHYPFYTVTSRAQSSILNVALGENGNFAFPTTLYTHPLLLYSIPVQLR
jgi:hypothetical protein